MQLQYPEQDELDTLSIMSTKIPGGTLSHVHVLITRRDETSKLPVHQEPDLLIPDI